MSLNLRNMISGSSLRAISLARDGAADENNQLRVLDDDLSAGSSIASACIISFQVSQDVKSQYPRTNDLKSTSCIICSAARAALFPLITISTRAQSSFFPISAALSYNLRYISLVLRPTYCVYQFPDGSYLAGNFFAQVFITFLAMYYVASDGFKLKKKTRAKKFPAWYDPSGNGYTQYVGRKASEIYLRLYDKAAEMGKNEDWARVEIVIRGKRAARAAEQIIQDVDFRSLVRGYCDFTSWDNWNEIMHAEAIELPADRSSSNTLNWLFSSAAPSLAREMALSEEPEIIFLKFKDIVMQVYNELNSEQTVN